MAIPDARELLPTEKRIHLVVAYDPDALELDDQWKRSLANSLANDGLDQMRAHLLELEEQIPWNAVDNVRWEKARSAWMVGVSRPGTAQALGRALAQLEAVMLPHAFAPAWPELRESWVPQAIAASSAWRLRELLLLFEANLRWLRFFAHDAVYTPTLQTLLSSPLFKAIGKPKKLPPVRPTAVLAGFQRSLHNILHRNEAYSFDDTHAFAAATRAALASHACYSALCSLLERSLTDKGGYAIDGANTAEAALLFPAHRLPQHLRHVAWLQGGRTERDTTPGIGDPVSLRPPLSAASTAKAAAAAAQHAAARKVSGSWAIHADAQAHSDMAAACGKAQAARAEGAAAGPTRTLLVFEDDANDDSLAGMVIVRPYHTLADLRVLIEAELGLPAPHTLCRARRAAGSPPTAAASAAGKAAVSSAAELELEQPFHPELVLIRPTQDHKLAYAFFLQARDVLVVRRRPRSDISLPECARVLLRPREPERLLCLDISCGLERLPIPVYNGCDHEPPPLDFSYVPQCVAVESVGLLALYDAEWPHPAGCGCTGSCVLDGGVCACVHRDGVRESYARQQPAYEASRRLKRAYESIYECHLLCACALSCANRVVQRGISVRLEVFRTPRAGWAVRTVDAVVAGSFICEYAGEHLPDDEAEERGIRYDQNGMSRLMDVQGDGPDALRMCVDATNFSSVARFVNHSCSPNCHKQRVFADHHTRLPRVALFALRDIAPLEEISYDYGYLDVPGKTLPCHCGARNCKMKLY